MSIEPDEDALSPEEYARMLSPRDALGHRLKIGVIGPSTNTTVQPDFDGMRPHGVTNHYSRIIVENATAISNASFAAGTAKIAENVLDAVRSVMSSSPDFLSMGMSAITFQGGKPGAERFRKSVEDVSGLQLSTGSLSLIAAFEAYGGIKRLAFLSPYFPVANAQVKGFFEDYGLEVVRDICFRCPSWTAIAHVREDYIRDRLHELDGPDVDALVQVGTNLSMVRLAAAAELWLGKPVIAINTATYWNALRMAGIPDKVPGFGRLLEEF
jgi:maleate isomerase